jgi:tetratricopeptide (TPR) repeat protein
VTGLVAGVILADSVGAPPDPAGRAAGLVILVALGALCVAIPAALYRWFRSRRTMAGLPSSPGGSTPKATRRDHTGLVPRVNWQRIEERSRARLVRDIEECEQELAGYERDLGPDDPATLACRDRLGALYLHAGRPDAVAVLEQNLREAERVLGADHKNTIFYRGALCQAYGEAGRIDEKIALLERNIAASERVLGQDHRATLDKRLSLGINYDAAGRGADGIAMLERAAADCERVLGRADEMTLTAQAALGSAYRGAGRINESINLLQQVRADCEREFGRAERLTIAVGMDLEMAYNRAGRRRDARALARVQRVAIRESEAAAAARFEAAEPTARPPTESTGPR